MPITAKGALYLDLPDRCHLRHELKDLLIPCDDCTTTEDGLDCCDCCSDVVVMTSIGYVTLWADGDVTTNGVVLVNIAH